ncbi:signal recognition particle-docking protein FtsY [Methyloglobulus sp.]|uniref:signal recognition particle-docking protein FtsY n=1 Tax=Methyloglobulus sp. TaxID=2518622 RepID=UPI0032B80EEE
MGIEPLFGLIQPQDVHFKAAYALAAVTLVVLLMAWWQAHCRAAAVMAAFGLAGLLGLQVALGIGILKAPDQALLITGHLLLGMTVFWSFFWLHLRTDRDISRSVERTGPLWFARFAIVLLFLQIALGSWVSVNHATVACSGFPQCNGQWWPEADYQGILNGLMAKTGEMSYATQVAVNWLHRVGALACFILLNGLMLVAAAVKNSKSVQKAGLWLSFLLFVQVGLGVVGYKFAMPLWIVIAHTGFAALLMLPLIAISFYSRYGFVEVKSSVKKARPEPAVLEIKPEADIISPKVLAPEVATIELDEPYVEPAPESVYQRLKTQLSRTRTGIGSILANLPLGLKDINEDLLEEIEASLLMADVGIDVTTKVINRLTQRLERQQLSDSSALTLALKQELLSILAPCSKPLQIPKQDKPFVILVIGVNGVGKTTTIGKLAKRLSAQGHSVMLAAGDTFRAAAVEQLQVWGQRNNIHVVAQHTGADSASVIYDGIQSAQAKGVDVLIADTAGRLHTKDNLMEELKKVKRIMAKLDETAPHEVILVLDSGTGQNALSQAKLFNEAIGLTGLVLTKLDGTAKGGVIFALAKQSGIPIRFIGVGEGIDDLQDFNAETFVDALFVKD